MKKQPIKLELKHLSPYLAYGIKVIAPEIETPLNVYGLFNMDGERILNIAGRLSISIRDCKPLLLPLSEFNGSDAYNEINEFHSVDFENNTFNDAMGDVDTEYLPYKVMEVLLRYHFDIFGLIDAGLALNKNDYPQPK